jgi:hypothetical protein
VSYVCEGKTFKSMSDAKVFAELLFKSKGVIAAIERKTKTSKVSQKLIEARIQRAVVGFRIPMMKIPVLYKVLEAELAAGKSDAELRTSVASFPGVEVAA